MKYNYLNTLPNKSIINNNYNLYINLINKMINSSDNTCDYTLLDFRYKLIFTLVNKILDNTNNFYKENYFLLKNNLIILDEILIKSSSNELVTLLNEKDNKIINYIKILNNVHDFSCSYKRKQVIENNKKIYKVTKKEIISEDIFLYIDEISKDIKQFLTKILIKLIDDNNYLDSLNEIKNSLIKNEQLKQEIYDYVTTELSYLNNSELTIFKQIIDNYIKNYIVILEILIKERKKVSIFRNDGNNLKKEKELDYLVYTKKYKCRK